MQVKARAGREGSIRRDSAVTLREDRPLVTRFSPRRFNPFSFPVSCKEDSDFAVSSACGSDAFILPG